MTRENRQNHSCRQLSENVQRYEATFGTIERKMPKNAPTKGGIPNPFEGLIVFKNQGRHLCRALIPNLQINRLCLPSTIP